MKQTRWFTLALALALLAPLLAGLAAVSAGGPIGGMFLIRDEAVDTKDPAVAYNSQRQEYLVVFWNDRPGCDDIRAERVSKDGKLLGGVWVAYGCPADRRYPDVAYNSQANEYLVVWQEDDIDIRGQRVSATGGLVGGMLIIATGTVGSIFCTSPAVAYASTENKYLVVSELRDTTAGYGIWAQALNSDGSVWGSGFSIVPQSVGYKLDSDLAYNYLRNEFLVVWAQDFINKSNIRGQRVKMLGGAAPLGSAFWISPWDPNEDLHPAVAAVPRFPDGQYLVAWEYRFSATDHDIWAQRVAGEGTLEGSVIGVYSSPQYDMSPAVAGSESNQQYLLVWTRPSDPPFAFHHIYGRAISTGGALLGQTTWVGGGFSSDYAAVAAGPLGDFLIAFQDDQGSGNDDIWGSLWGNRLYLPLVLKNH
ncbi:MAG: hypothetical protein FJZ89_01370 [Chloroflexi bacterium]|nr:hypothetical protein [Chloroflexota bacterium]